MRRVDASVDVLLLVLDNLNVSFHAIEWAWVSVDLVLAFLPHLHSCVEVFDLLNDWVRILAD